MPCRHIYSVKNFLGEKDLAKLYINNRCLFMSDIEIEPYIDQTQKIIDFILEIDKNESNYFYINYFFIFELKYFKILLVSDE